MPDLESDEPAEQRKNQRGPGLKILTPQQISLALSISLTQLKSGNNSEKCQVYNYCIYCIDKKS